MRRNLIECKAAERLGTERRQQLWNYMMLTKILCIWRNMEDYNCIVF